MRKIRDWLDVTIRENKKLLAGLETEQASRSTVTLACRAGSKSLEDLDEANQKALVEAVGKLERQKPGR